VDWYQASRGFFMTCDATKAILEQFSTRACLKHFLQNNQLCVMRHTDLAPQILEGIWRDARSQAIFGGMRDGIG